jgi:hypothetical protein
MGLQKQSQFGEKFQVGSVKKGKVLGVASHLTLGRRPFVRNKPNLPPAKMSVTTATERSWRETPAIWA